VVDRALFIEWLAEAEERMNEELRGPVPAAGPGLAGWIRSWAAETKAATVILAVAFLVVLISVVQVVGAHPDAAASAPRGAVPKASPDAATGVPSKTAAGRSTPRAVAIAYLAAISRHDWHAVWELGGKNVGLGQSASYAGMVAGYQGTVKDVPVKIQVNGWTASGQFHAYESDGEVRTYAFSYVVRGTEIVHAAVRELSSTRVDG
jgi:hypothetical protein